MTTDQTEQPTEERLPYEKPVLRSISLSADQVLSSGCKNGAQSGPTGVCAAMPCLGDGS
jgi:hypothetical protein